MEKSVVALVLAAGKGTRMKSEKSKLVHKIYGKELVKRVVETAKKSGIDDIVTVVGYKKEVLQNHFSPFWGRSAVFPVSEGLALAHFHHR